METEHFRSSGKYSVMISFLCTVAEAANGMESINVANVQAQNALFHRMTQKCM